MPSPSKAAVPHGFLNSTAASEALQLSRNSVRSYIRSGRLEAVRIGGRFLITKRSVDALLTPSNVGGAK